jgi:RHS repeat-associated protein
MKKNKWMWVVIFLLAADVMSYAQWTNTVPQRGIVPGVSYDGGGLDNINMVNGNIYLNFPLTSLPAGPGGSGANVSFVYNSAIWDQQIFYAYQVQPGGALTPLPYPRLITGNSYKIGGLGYELKLEFRAVPGSVCTCNWYDPNPITNLYHPQLREAVYNYRLKAVFPDGSEHILYLVDPDGPNNQAGDEDLTDGGGWFAFDPSGHPSTCLSSRPGGQGNLSGALIYYTNDGTKLRLTIIASQDWTNQEWDMYLPEGTKIHGVGRASNIIFDRNNNKITSTGSVVPCDSGPNPPACIVTTIADDNNRWIQVADYPSKITIIQQTKSNEQYLTWVLTKGVTHVNFVYGCVEWTNATGQGWTECPMDMYRQVITEIRMPGYSIPNTANVYSCEDVMVNNEATNPCIANYKLSYNDLTGRLTDIYLPYDGGASAPSKIHYEYVGNYSNGWHLLDYPVKEKTLTYQNPAGNPGIIQNKWSYDIWPFTQPTLAINPDGGQVLHYFHDPYAPGSILAGRTYRIDYPDGSRMERYWARTTDPEARIVVNSVAGGGITKSAVTKHKFDFNGNLLEKHEYDWMPYSNIEHDSNSGIINGFIETTSLRSTINTYYTGVGEEATGNQYEYNRTTARLLTAIAEKRINYGLTRALATYKYGTDNADAFSTGNLTEEWKWDSTKGDATTPLSGSNAILITREYAGTGDLLSEKDPNNVEKRYEYNDATHPYPTNLHLAYNTADQRDWQFEWDTWSGLMTAEIDANNGTRVEVDHDLLGRQIQVKEGTSSSTWLRKANTLYNDLPSTRTIMTMKDLYQVDDPNPVVTNATKDRLGRVWKAESTGDNNSEIVKSDKYEIVCVGSLPAGYSHPQNCPSGMPIDMYGYTYQLSSNPNRNVNESTMGWTRTKLDKMNRVIEVAHFEGSARPLPWGSNIATTGKVTTSYSLDTQTVIDEVNKRRATTKDALGRLVQVTEAESTVHSTITQYSYDTLDNLIWVIQGDQTRSFNYSSLGRLTYANNPENGVYNYEYYDNGNLRTKTHSSGSVVTMTYNNLSSIETKSYSDGTPSVTYTYKKKNDTSDPNCSGGNDYAVGRLTSVSRIGVSSYYYKCYNALGRVIQSKQSTSGKDYKFSYHYLPGFMDSITYPSERVVTYSSNSRGLPSGATGYVSDVDYTASGALQNLKLANGITEIRGYNSRLQMGTLIAANNSVHKLSLTYTYTDPISRFNNGNLYSQQIQYDGDSSIPESAFNQTQSYTYDDYNRLHSITENANNRTFDYDIYGNQKIIINTGFNLDPRTPKPTSYDSATNRINAPLGTVSYDTQGNQTKLGPFILTYNGDDLVKSVMEPDQTNSYEKARYQYDGEGRRVRKVTCSNSVSNCTDSEATAKIVFVYDAAGRLMMEDSTAAGTTGTEYNTADALGSIRLVTDGSGVPKRRYDYLPFGEEITQGINGRSNLYPVPNTTGASDGQAKKFTGKERDAETGLDYFGARYLSSSQGRFASPDIPFIDQSEDDPQSWNLYSYVGNNPLSNTDPTGMYKCGDACQHGIPPDVIAFWLWSWEQDAIEDLKKVAQTVQQIVEPVVDWVTQPRNPLCTAAYMGSGAAIGGTAGGGVGALGFAAGPVGLATTPTFSAGGAAIGSGIGGIGGMIMCSQGSGQGGGGFREKTRGANRKDAEQISAAAREVGVDRYKFSEFIHKLKRSSSRGGSDNFEYQELIELAKQFKAGSR